MQNALAVPNRRRFFGLMAATAALSTIPVTGIIGCSTDWIAVAEKDVPIVVNIAEIVASIVESLTGTAALSPVILAAIQEAASIFSAAVQTLSDAIAAYKQSASQGTLNAVVAAINAVEEDAPKVIQAITQAPANLISIITSAIGTAIALLSAIESLLPAASVSLGNKVAVASARRVKVARVKLPDPQALKSGFNSVLSVYGYGQFQVK